MSSLLLDELPPGFQFVLLYPAQRPREKKGPQRTEVVRFKQNFSPK
jgi:hypothetical protein